MFAPGGRLSGRTWLALAALALAVWFVIHFAGLIFEVLLVLFGAYLLSLAITPLADLLARRGVPRWVAVVLFYALLLGLLVVLGMLLVPVVRTEMRELRRNLPGLIQRDLAWLRSVPLLAPWVPRSDVLSQQLGQRAPGLFMPVFQAIVNTGSRLLDLAVVVVLSFFLVTDRGLGRWLVYNWLPVRHQEGARRVSSDLRRRLTRWIWAQAAVGVYFAAAFSVVLALLRVPYAFSIGLVGGALEIIPYFGGFVAFLLAVLSAATVNPVLIIWVAVLYLIVIEIESHVLAPTLYGRVTGLHPAAVLVALLIGAKAAHLVGILFAVPAAVVVGTALRELRAELVRRQILPAGEDSEVEQP